MLGGGERGGGGGGGALPMQRYIQTCRWNGSVFRDVKYINGGIFQMPATPWRKSFRNVLIEKKDTDRDSG